MTEHHHETVLFGGMVADRPLVYGVLSLSNEGGEIHASRA